MFDFERLKKTIRKKGYTQEEFAKAIGISKVTLNNYLTGRTKLDVETLIKIAQVLGVPVSYFFGEASLSRVSRSQNVVSEAELLKKELEKVQAELEGCRELLKAKDEIIQMLKQMKK